MLDKTKIFSAAEKAVLKGQIPKAIEYLEQIVRKDPRDAKALNKLADLFLKESQKDRAVELLKKVGEIYHRDGFYSKAAAIYKRILKIEDQAPKEELIEVHERLAELYQQLDLASEAMPHFKIVVDYYDQTENRESLLRVLRSVSELDPGNLDSQLKLAELFITQGRSDEAQDTLVRLEESIVSERSLADVARFYEKWLDLFPGDPALLQKLVGTYLSGGEPKRGLAVLQKAFRADPYNADVLELLSETFTKLDQEDKARAVDTELLKMYRKNGDQEKVAIVEARVKGVKSDSHDAQTRQASRQEVDAIDPAEALIHSSTESPEEKKVLSECEVYLKYGLAEKAKEVLSDQLQNHPKSLALRWKLKNVLMELKQVEMGKQILSEIMLLAKERKSVEWEKIAADEMAGTNRSSPVESPEAVEESVAPAAPEPKKPEPEPSPSFDTAAQRVSGLSDPDDSDISIVLEDDFAAELELSNHAEEVPELLETEDVGSPPGSSGELELNMDVEPLELADVAETVEKGRELPEAISDPSDELVQPDFLLSEDDFSEKELQQLGQQLTGEDTMAGIGEETGDVIDLSLDSHEEPISADISSDAIESSPDREFEIRQGLEEIQFFKSQGLDKEASELLASLKKKYPDNESWDLPAGPLEEDRAAANTPLSGTEIELEALGTKMKLTVQEDDRDETADFFDLAGELQGELADDETKDSNVPVEVKDVFKAFKDGVAQSVSEDDVDTHFDLAIAYREMGLLDDAYEAFKLCSRSDRRRTEALHQMGSLQMMRENLADAKELFSQALSQPSLENQQKISLTYELGEVFLRQNDLSSAKKTFEEVQNLDPGFRDVQEKLTKLA